jgi:hypothetical protein
MIENQMGSLKWDLLTMEIKIIDISKVSLGLAACCIGVQILWYACGISAIISGTIPESISPIAGRIGIILLGVALITGISLPIVGFDTVVKIER